ncbi:aminotransferase class III-fold pyridoxal phosphate-dependent enzyme [candidate division KSB1 bacterium]|nr:aminotransferase class III-fold pyridoxal phosphate-dependent enzyme [candidate division KSB1 bacterium]
MTPKHERHYKRAMELIPWGTQTNAKRLTAGCEETMPPFIKRAKGCHMWDLDDKEYIDYRCSLGPIILGYCYPSVDAAVKKQMENGSLFSMASPLEVEAAEALMENLTWVEQIRFMKTGADACTCCTRLARTFTGRDHILTSGYHGFHDVFALEWPNPGVPNCVRDTVHHVPYNDIEAAEKIFETYGEQLAAAIIVPYEWQKETCGEWIHRLRQLCDHYGSLLIFDEVLTGFRLAKGGAQEYYGVTPDFAAYAKAMANGYPVSAYGGKRQYMQTLENTIITTTYAGETLSLAACIAVMEVMKNESVHDHINAMGRKLRDGFNAIFQQKGFPAEARGLDMAPFIHHMDGSDDSQKEMRNRLFVRLYDKGVFANDSWFINYSHQSEDIELTLEKMEQSIREIK